MRFLISLLAIGLTLPAAHAEETVRHISGSSYSWPGRDDAAGDYLASGENALLAPSRSAPTDATGGFGHDLGIMSRYGLYADTVSRDAIDRLVRRHRPRIRLNREFLEAIRITARDLHVFRVFKDFLEAGGTLAPVSHGGRYTADPLRIIVGMEDKEDVIEAAETLFHELLHYVFDKTDSILWEAHDSGGADHLAIAALEQRFAIAQLARTGDTGLLGRIGPLDGYTRLGKILPRIASLLGTPADLIEYLRSDEYHRAYVHSAMVTPLSGRKAKREGRISGLILSDAQIQDIASLAAYHSVVLAGVLETMAHSGDPVRFISETADLRTSEPLASPRAQAEKALTRFRD